MQINFGERKLFGEKRGCNKMKFRDRLAERYDAFCDAVEKINLDPVKRVLPIVLFVFVSLASVLYAAGVYDFTFIERPEKKESPAPVDTAVTPEPKETETGGADTAEEPDVTGGDTAPEPEPEVKEFYFPMIGDKNAEGYYVTNTDYSADTHVIAAMNVELGSPKEYTLRRRNVYSPKYDYEYENGEAKVIYVLEDEDRPAVEAYMGYIMVDNGSAVIMFDAYGRYVANYDESYYLAYTRDSSGNPLFFRPSSYTVYTEDGERSATVDTRIYYTLSSAGYMAQSAYNDRIEGRGLHMDYPATYGAQTAPIGRRCIENAVSFLSLKDKLTGWNRTVWGFFEPGSDLPFTDGWYDVDEEKPDVDKMTPEEQKEYLEKEREEEKKRIYTAYNYSEGYACVANEKGQMHFIDTAGKQTFETEIDTYNAYGRRVIDNLLLPLTDGEEALGFYYFDHGLVRVRRQIYDYYQLKDFDMKMIEYDNDELIYADGTKFLLAEGYDIISYSNGLILLEKGGRYGYMDYTGAWLIEPSLSGAKPFVEGLAAVAVNGKWGMIDTAGNTVIPFDYDSVQSVSSGVIVCHSDRGWTIFVKMKKDA